MSETAMPSSYKDQRWVTGSGVLSGKPARVRKNVSLVGFDTRTAPYLVLVTLVYKELDLEGFPVDADEALALDETEVRLADALEKNFKAHFAMAITSGGARDLFFFHPDATTDTTADALVQLIEPAVDYEISLVHDPIWRPYREILPEAADALTS